MKTLGTFIFLFFLITNLFAQETITILNTPQRGYYKPLEEVKLKITDNGTLSVKDAKGQSYFSSTKTGELLFHVSGFPGYHSIVLSDKNGVPLNTITFKVDCETEISDNEGEWSELFKQLKWNLYKPMEFKIIPYHGKPYFLLSDWLRDHTNILKGKKYFFTEIKDAVDLFGETQLENGMVFDFCMPYEGNFWADRFDNKDFIDVQKKEAHVFERIPLENDVEFWFVMAIYHTWKATDDDIWMNKWLNAAEKALKYDMTSEYVWSEKYQLLKRPLTIDTWDFMPGEEAAITGGDIMENIPGKSRYGIMHGDNTGFAMACGHLAEMFDYIGNTEKAKEWQKVQTDILKKLTEISWNGEFYTHFVDEDPTIKRDLGVDMAKQVSLSNTYALNRDIPHEQAVAIIKTYQRIKEEMPESSPGEFYSMYPPFEKGFHFQTWHYVNGGVFPFIAGELAKGSLEHGYENYGVDILQRVNGLLKKNEGQFPYYWIGKIPEAPKTNFTKLSIEKQANVDFSGKETNGITAWTGEGPENDLSKMPSGKQTFEGIPFNVIDPGENGRKACIGLASSDGYLEEVLIPVNQTAKSLYFLHTLAGGGMTGWININYKDGASHRKYINSGSELKNWWNPSDVAYSRATGWKCKVAWHAHNGRADVGVYVFGYNNPYPEKEIKDVQFVHSKQSNKWFVLGLTLSDQEVYFKWPWRDGQWLVNWNTGCLMNAYVDGLAGVQDIGVSYDKAILSPKWAATNSKNVDVTVKYPASGNYMAYSYEINDNTINLKTAGVSKETKVEILLPKGKKAKELRINGKTTKYTPRSIENSNYIVFILNDISYKEIEITLE